MGGLTTGIQIRRCNPRSRPAANTIDYVCTIPRSKSQHDNRAALSTARQGRGMPHASWECEWASQQAIGLLHSPSYAGNSWPSVACHPWLCIPYQVDQGARVKPQPEMGTSRWLTRRPVAPPVRSRPSPPQGTPDQNRLVHNIVRTITHVMVDMPPTGFGGYFAPGALQLGLDALNSLFVDCVLPEGLPMGRAPCGDSQRATSSGRP